MRISIAGIVAFFIYALSALPTPAQTPGPVNEPSPRINIQTTIQVYQSRGVEIADPTVGCTKGVFKIYCIDDGKTLLINDGRARNDLALHNDGSTRFQVGDPGDTGWWDGLEDGMRGASDFVLAMTNPALVLAACMTVMFFSVVTAAGKALESAMAIYRGMMVILLLPCYSWFFVRCHGLAIWVNNSIYTNLIGSLSSTGSSTWSDNLGEKILEELTTLLGLGSIIGGGISSFIHSIYTYVLNFGVVFVFVWGAIACFSLIFGTGAGWLFQGWLKATLSLYSIFILLNTTAGLCSLIMATTEFQAPLWLASEAMYMAVFGGTALAMLNGGNPVQGMAEKSLSLFQTAATAAATAASGGAAAVVGGYQAVQANQLIQQGTALASQAGASQAQVQAGKNMMDQGQADLKRATDRRNAGIGSVARAQVAMAEGMSDISGGRSRQTQALYGLAASTGWSTKK